MSDHELRRFAEIKALARRIADADWNDNVNLLRAFHMITETAVAMALTPETDGGSGSTDEE